MALVPESPELAAIRQHWTLLRTSEGARQVDSPKPQGCDVRGSETRLARFRQKASRARNRIGHVRPCAEKISSRPERHARFVRAIETVPALLRESPARLVAGPPLPQSAQDHRGVLPGVGREVR